MILSTAGIVLNSNLQLYLDINFFYAFSVIEFPVLFGILRPIFIFIVYEQFIIHLSQKDI